MTEITHDKSTSILNQNLNDLYDKAFEQYKSKKISEGSSLSDEEMKNQFAIEGIKYFFLGDLL